MTRRAVWRRGGCVAAALAQQASQGVAREVVAASALDLMVAVVVCELGCVCHEPHDPHACQLVPCADGYTCAVQSLFSGEILLRMVSARPSAVLASPIATD